MRIHRNSARSCRCKRNVCVFTSACGLRGLEKAPEVITSPFSFVASANCILYERGTPVFVDIDEETLNIDPAAVGAAITNRTVGILPIHVFGRPAAMDSLCQTADRHSLVLIEDACEALGAMYRNRKVGTFRSRFCVCVLSEQANDHR